MKWIPTTTGNMLEILSPQDLHKSRCDSFAMNMIPLWSRPGIEVLQSIDSINNWIHSAQQILPINGLQWLYEKKVAVKPQYDQLTYRSPFEGKEIIITPGEFAEKQVIWQLPAITSLSAPLEALNNADAVAILKEWISQAISVAEQRNQRVIMELPCLSLDKLAELIDFFELSDPIIGLVLFLEDNADQFLIAQQNVQSLAQNFPNGWLFGIQTNLEFDLLKQLYNKEINWMITETPYQDAKKGFFYADEQRVAITDKEYETKIQPLVNNCGCDTCLQFSCAYIHHLMNMQEVYAWRLIAIHNWYQLQKK